MYYVCMYVCMCLYVLHSCKHVSMHVCLYACLHVCMFACMHVCMYACMHSMYSCMHLYLYMNVLMHECMYVSTFNICAWVLCCLFDMVGVWLIGYFGYCIVVWCVCAIVCWFGQSVGAWARAVLDCSCVLRLLFV